MYQCNKHLCAGFYQSIFSLRLVWKLTLRAFAILITFAETSSTKYFLKTVCLLFTCLLRKLRCYGNTIMRDNILAPIIIFECTLLHVYIQYQYRTKQLSLFYYVHKPNENKCCLLHTTLTDLHNNQRTQQIFWKAIINWSDFQKIHNFKTSKLNYSTTER